MTTMIDTAPNLPQLPGWQLSRLVIGRAGASRPCARPDADPEDWFPAELEREQTPDRAYAMAARAAALCRHCPVELACLERAICQEGPRLGHGIAGGTTPRQRQDIKISRGLVSARDLAGAA
jgi:Transcription factor WhiB